LTAIARTARRNAAHPADRRGQADCPASGRSGAVALVRDLVNTPAEDMGPAELEHEAELLARPIAPPSRSRGARRWSMTTPWSTWWPRRRAQPCPAYDRTGMGR
jgi:hypothetical protein